jgi:hypothetical protein
MNGLARVLHDLDEIIGHDLLIVLVACLRDPNCPANPQRRPALHDDAG